MEREITLITTDLLKNAYFELGRIVDGLPDGPLSEQQQRNWEKRRKRNIDEFGDGSIFTMFPERLKKDYRFLVRSTNCLYRQGIRTKSQLVNAKSRDIAQVPGIGIKTLKLFSTMKDIAFLELSLKHS
jgi:DNA-directed RNA polymerase alpha subunit